MQFFIITIKSSLLYLKLFSHFLLLPIILWQGKQLKAKAIELPEAKGARAGQVKCRQPEKMSGTSAQAKQHSLAFLHVGESTVAGVGVENFQQGLSATIAESIADLDYNTHWTSIGQSGVRIKSLIKKVDKALTGEQTLDSVIVTLGVNDASQLVSMKQWRQQLSTLVELLTSRCHNPQLKIFFSQVPPMQDFPILRFPLSSMLGCQAALMNLELQKLANSHQDIFYIQSGLKLQANFMAVDGFHPNAQGYKLWGQLIGQQVVQQQSN